MANSHSYFSIKKVNTLFVILAIPFSFFACSKSAESNPSIQVDSKKNKVDKIEEVIQEEAKSVEPGDIKPKEESVEKKVEPAKPKPQKEPTIPEIYFKEKVFKFGDIDQGDTVVHSYMFINSGNAPLYITDVDLSCGCTMSDYPKTAIKPRQAGHIELMFNSTHKEGSQRQFAIVSSNTIPGKDTLLLAGVVYRKMEEFKGDSISN